MHTRTIICLAVLLAAAAGFSTSSAAAAPPVPTEAPLTANQLIYEGTTIEFQLDVNGEAAAQLLGDLLDAAAEIAHEQADAMAKAGVGPVPPHVAVIAEPLIDPAKDVIKSITWVTLLVMRPDESVNTEEAMGYYHRLMTSRGWTPMVTIRADSGERILVLLAPGGKGLFAAIIPGHNEIVVGIITTTEPLGELLAQIIRAGGSEALQGILIHPHRAHPAPEAPAETAPEPAPEE